MKAQCPNCQAPISGEAGVGMIMCPKCGELVMLEAVEPPSPMNQPSAPEVAPDIFKDVVEFANQDQPSLGFGALVYDVEISGIDTAELREEIQSHLTDQRLQLNVAELIGKIADGVMHLPKLNPVKASVILNRLRHLPVKVKWVATQLIKEQAQTLLVLIFIFFTAAKVWAGDWKQHELNLRDYAIRINATEEDLRTLIVKKGKNNDPVTRDKILEEIKKKNQELNRLFGNFREEKEHILYEHPEQGDNTERKYKHVKMKTLDELEAETGIDGKLNKLKNKVERTYPQPSGAPSAAPTSPNSAAKDQP